MPRLISFLCLMFVFYDSLSWVQILLVSLFYVTCEGSFFHEKRQLWESVLVSNRNTEKLLNSLKMLASDFSKFYYCTTRGIEKPDFSTSPFTVRERELKEKAENGDTSALDTLLTERVSDRKKGINILLFPNILKLEFLQELDKESNNLPPDDWADVLDTTQS